MLCRYPFIRDPTGKVFRTFDREQYLDGIPFPCGQCLPCRINRRRIWTLRLMLESFLHDRSSFVTLTYSDDSLPYTLDGRPTLCKRDVQLFVKRLRKAFHPKKFRYYCCGEYGAKSGRPHYHIILFGIGPNELDPTWSLYDGKSPSSYLLSTWSSTVQAPSIVHVGEVSRLSVQYTAGYVTKKLTKKDDERQKEFSLMSRRPGIGHDALNSIARALDNNSENSTPAVIRIDGRLWPLGRYLLDKLDTILGDGNDRFETYLTKNFVEYAEYTKQKASSVDVYSFLEYVVGKDDARFASLDARNKIFNSRSTI